MMTASRTMMHDELFGAIVHELRSPLNACLMTLSLLELKATEPASVEAAVAVLRRNLERQASLIETLADAAQAEPTTTAPAVSDAARLLQHGVDVIRCKGCDADVLAPEANVLTGVEVAGQPEALCGAVEVLLDWLFDAHVEGTRARIEVTVDTAWLGIAVQRVAPPAPEVADRAGTAPEAREPPQPPAGLSARKLSPARLAQLLRADTVLLRTGARLERDVGGFRMWLRRADE